MHSIWGVQITGWEDPQGSPGANPPDPGRKVPGVFKDLVHRDEEEREALPARALVPACFWKEPSKKVSGFGEALSKPPQRSLLFTGTTHPDVGLGHVRHGARRSSHLHLVALSFLNLGKCL